ncbi:hypothetical protein M8J77_019236 [Diaphorina citri]|nr:hypothetical protein M8J77_019236 [Diaphorina citri]
MNRRQLVLDGSKGNFKVIEGRNHRRQKARRSRKRKAPVKLHQSSGEILRMQVIRGDEEENYKQNIMESYQPIQ